VRAYSLRPGRPVSKSRLVIVRVATQSSQIAGAWEICRTHADDSGPRVLQPAPRICTGWPNRRVIAA